jgi:uncharacterized membrane protein (TIGR02234 family)
MTRSRSRSRSLAFSALLVGGLLGLIAGGQPWWRATGGGTSVTFTGNEASGGLTWSWAAVVLAGVLLALVLRARGRQVVAVLLALVSVGMLLTGVLHQRPTSEGVRTRMAQVSLADAFALEPTGWPWGYAAGGLLALTGAAVMLLRAPRWPARTARFDRAERSGSFELADDPAGAWQALDAGEDPTDVDPDAHQGRAAAPMDDTPGTPNPDVQSNLPGDTMGTQGGSDTRREPS